LSPSSGRITSSGVRALASAPHIEPLGVYFILALSIGCEMVFFDTAEPASNGYGTV